MFTLFTLAKTLRGIRAVMREAEPLAIELATHYVQWQRQVLAQQNGRKEQPTERPQYCDANGQVIAEWDESRKEWVFL